MPTYTYQPINAYGQATGKCPACGKSVKRSKKFQCTVNPFNRNEKGIPRSVAEVREQVTAEVRAWVPDFTHAKCAEAKKAD